MGTDNDLFTFLSIANALDRTFNIYLSRWQLFTQLALIAVIPQIILSVIIHQTFPTEDPDVYTPFTEAPAAEGEEEVPIPTMSPQLIAASLIQIPYSFLVTIIIQAAIIQVVAEYYTQKLSAFRGSLVVAADRFCAIYCYSLVLLAGLLLFSLVVGILIGVLMVIQAPQFFLVLAGLAAFVFTIFVLLSLTLVLPILVIEKLQPIAAIRRSFELLPTYRCYVFCSMFVLGILVFFGCYVYQIMMGAIFGSSTMTVVFSGLAAVVTVPLQTIIAAVLYFSVRSQKEGLNMETLLNEMQMSSGGDRTYKNVLLAEDVDNEVV